MGVALPAAIVAVTQFNKQRRGRKRETKERRQLELENAAIRANVQRNSSAQFGGAVPGRAPASDGGPPRVLQGAGSSLLTGGNPEPFFPNQRRRT